MNENAPIGLYDSGIGGLSVVREVFRQLPSEEIIYFGDTARVPYGPRPAAEILAFNQEIMALLLAAGAKLIVIACNTSSALALPRLREQCPVPLIGLITPGVEAALAATRNQEDASIGVIATQATTRSRAYSQALTTSGASVGRHVNVREVACPALVPLVESGDWNGKVAEAVVAEALAPFVALPPDALILGCTHYPHLAPLIGRLLGPTVKLVDPAGQAIATAGRVLTHAGLRATRSPFLPPAHRFLVSGDPEPFFHTARQMFPGCVDQVQQVPLGSPCVVL